MYGINSISMKKTAVCIIAVATGVLLFAGCGSKKTQQTSGEVQTVTDGETVQKPKAVKEIYEEVTQAVSLASPVLMNDDFIMNYYGIDSAKLEEYIFSMSEDATKAECVIVMKVKDAGDADELAGCLQIVVDEKKNEMENYLPEQFTIVEKSEVQTKGNYVWLVISEQADTILEIIEKNVAG